ncbi:hypothetical protein EKO04_010654 [Ascochyta lentis]|uniref:Uncharacterized protein n=1 Tax=Ascochyta lentis TaxID=205686 RepID=A0A8H7IUZ0_9PLEO|nr:hypothetical protein EKO04_010654 [Ascochyta lentis]
MDHWGDPWADNASHKSPTKDAVASPLPSAFSFAPIPLNGFVDDAGWGTNDDDGFGDWATSPRVSSGNVASAGVESPPAGDRTSDSARWGTASHKERDDLAEGWPEAASNTAQDFEQVDSEPSDSATVSRLDEAVDRDAVEEPTLQLQPDVESVRSSTSPSETSRNEVPVESPRTSIEDERGITKDQLPQDEVFASTLRSDAIVADASPESEFKEEDSGEVPENSENVDKHAPDIGDAKESLPSSSGDSREPDVHEEPSAISDDVTTAVVSQPHVQTTAFACDEAALAQLFPSKKDPGDQLDTHDDPIYSTSARKAWYRLTRKQTMREFNHGDNDDNYIRVTWTNSHVRAEVNKVVGRWAREDRISGTGPGARASFYWDTAAPPEPKAPFRHSRTQSSVPTTKTVLPARQSMPPLATGKPAAFDWSSPAPADPWKLDGPAQHSISTPLTLKNPAVSKIQRQEGRAVSVDLTPRRPEQTAHKRTATVSHASSETTAVANLISPPISQPSSEVSDPWTNISSIGSSLISTVEAADPPIDDDDDWGEMVQTPTLPTPNQLDPFSQPAASNTENTHLPPFIKPSLQEVRSAQTESAESMFASPIVRLQSTISPTSALFQAKSFVPLHAEQGPIGPGILKPANRKLLPTSEQKPTKEDSIRSSSENVDVGTVDTSDDKDAQNGEDHAWTAPEPAPLSHKSEELQSAIPTNRDLTPIVLPATPVQASADPWADADFSFFESSLPVAASQPTAQIQEPSSLSDLSDPLSFFGTPDPTSTSYPPQPSSRSPPRDTTPPVLQPLTGATSSVQRRKAEEDQTISSILAGLPNLSYMLR